MDRKWRKGIERAKRWLSKAEYSRDEKMLSYSLLAAAELRRLRLDDGYNRKFRRRLILIVSVIVMAYILLVPSLLQDNIFLISRQKRGENKVYFTFTPSCRDLSDVQFWQYVELPSTSTEAVKTSNRVKGIKRVKEKLLVNSNAKKKVFTSDFQMIRLVEIGVKELYRQKGVFIMKKGGN